MARLIMRRGPTPGAVFQLDEEVITIGRGSKNDIIIQDNEVSREHCRLIRLLADYELQDLKSINGTFVNGLRVLENRLLEPGYIIELGDSITFEYEQIGGLNLPETDTADHRPDGVEAPPTPDSIPCLIQAVGPQAGRVYLLRTQIITVGRDETNDVIIHDPEISRNHLRLRQFGEGYIVEDLGSTNGTLFNEKRLDGPMPLRSGDKIKLATTVRLEYAWRQSDGRITDTKETRKVQTDTMPSVRIAELREQFGEPGNSRLLGGKRGKTSRLGTGLLPGSLENHIFIAYAREDWSDVVAPLTVNLQDAGLAVWVDQHLVQGGHDWMDAIEQALYECWLMLVIISPDAVNSRFVQMEYRYFVNREKSVLPVIYKPVPRMPVEMASLRSIEYDISEPEKSFNRLMLDILNMRR